MAEKSYHRTLIEALPALLLIHVTETSESVRLLEVHFPEETHACQLDAWIWIEPTQLGVQICTQESPGVERNQKQMSEWYDLL